jgi:hypothetical protein
VIGLIFIPIGAVILSYSGQVVEIETRYDNISYASQNPTTPPATSNFPPGCLLTQNVNSTATCADANTCAIPAGYVDYWDGSYNAAYPAGQYNTAASGSNGPGQNVPANVAACSIPITIPITQVRARSAARASLRTRHRARSAPPSTGLTCVSS